MVLGPVLMESFGMQAKYWMLFLILYTFNSNLPSKLIGLDWAFFLTHPKGRQHQCETYSKLSSVGLNDYK